MVTNREERSANWITMPWQNKQCKRTVRNFKTRPFFALIESCRSACHTTALSLWQITNNSNEANNFRILILSHKKARDDQLWSRSIAISIDWCAAVFNFYLATKLQRFTTHASSITMLNEWPMKDTINFPQISNLHQSNARGCDTLTMGKWVAVWGAININVFTIPRDYVCYWLIHQSV